VHYVKYLQFCGDRQLALRQLQSVRKAVAGEVRAVSLTLATGNAGGSGDTAWDIDGLSVFIGISEQK